MKMAILRTVGVLFALTLGLGACGGQRNCMVIPAQVDLLRERREVALRDLENKANQVDRSLASVRRIEERLLELNAEKAVLDSVAALQESRP